jgi:DNA polymerase III delta' subunit
MPKRLEELLLSPPYTADALQGLLAKSEPPQALLLVGSEGVGKRTLARTLAARWLCRQPDAGGACGTCESCTKWSKNEQHPDLQSLLPTPDQIKIEQVREARQWMNFAPVIAPYRVVAVEQAQTLNLHAANALLKTLEEPPTSYFFLLTADSTNMMLQTVLSRCRIVRLAPVDRERIRDYLLEKWGLSLEQAQRLAEYSEGAPGKAIQWAQESDEASKSPALGAMESFLKFCERLGGALSFEALRLAEDFREVCKGLEVTLPDRSARFALARGLEGLVEWYRDTLALDYGAKTIRFQSYLHALKKLQHRFPTAKRLQDLGSIVETRRVILGNANAQIATECLFIRLLSK